MFNLPNEVRNATTTIVGFFSNPHAVKYPSKSTPIKIPFDTSSTTNNISIKLAFAKVRVLILKFLVEMMEPPRFRILNLPAENDADLVAIEPRERQNVRGLNMYSPAA